MTVSRVLAPTVPSVSGTSKCSQCSLQERDTACRVSTHHTSYVYVGYVSHQK